MSFQKERPLIKVLVIATQAIANVVKSSFGPSGLDKMMVDDIGVCTVILVPAQPLLTVSGCDCYE